MKKDIYFIMIILVVFISNGCIKKTSVPFPEAQLGISEPTTVPLEFTPEQTIHWDTIKSEGFKPVVKRLNIEDLPTVPYDTSGFKPFPIPPKVSHFKFSELSDTTIDFEQLPSKPLDLEHMFNQPVLVHDGLPLVPIKSSSMALFDFGRMPFMNRSDAGAVIVDKNGLIWIGTRNGLLRYDGVNIMQYDIKTTTPLPIISIAEDQTGNIWFHQLNAPKIGVLNLKNNSIAYTTKITGINRGLTKMLIDKNGHIWLPNAKDNGVSIIDPLKQTYKTLDIHTGIGDSTVYQIAEDKNNNIWIATFNAGISILNRTTGQLTYLNRKAGLSADSTASMVCDVNGIMWLSTFNGINAIDIEKGTITLYNNAQHAFEGFSATMKTDARGRLWCFTGNTLDIIDPKLKQIRKIGISEGLHDGFISGIAFDSKQRAWISSIGGLNIIDQDAETVHPLGSTSIISMEEDASGNLWVATRTGALIIDAKQKTMRTLDESNGLSNNSVQDFSIIDGKIEISTNGGFNLIDTDKKTITVARKKEGLPSDTIYGIIKDHTGDFWISGPRGGIVRINENKKLLLGLNETNGLSNNNIMDVKQDREGLIWVASNSDGINIIDTKKNTIKYLNDQPGFRDTCTKVILIDDIGRIWIGTDQGIYVVDKKKETITNLSVKHGLSDDNILSLLPYGNSVIAGCRKMLNIVTPPMSSEQDWEIHILDKSEGIVKETNSWNTDAITRKGEYLYGDRGISLFKEIKPNHDSVPTYITGLSVMGNKLNFVNHHFNDRKDSLLAEKDAKYLVELGYADADKIRWDSVSGPYNLPVKLVLPHDENYMQFQFAQANLGRQSSTLYTYVLEGVDKKWSKPTLNPYSENYLNLAPGKYTFKVSSKGTDGQWKKPVQFSFSIAPPWYQTWLAYLVYVIISISLLRAYVVYRSRKLTKEKKMLEEKVAHRTKQLSKSLDDLKATQNQLVQSEKMASLGELTAGIAHEIQNPLNFVNNFSEVNQELLEEMVEEIEKGNLDEVKSIAKDVIENEQKINYHGKRADSIVKGMLQHSRSSSGIKEPTDINILADEYLRLAYHGLRAKDKSFNASMKTDFDESIGKIMVIPQDLGRVILNLITNAFYAVKDKKDNTQNASFEPMVTVTTRKVDKKVLISVKDNGNGIPQAALDKIFQPFFTTKPSGQGTGLGLSMSYEIITKAHGGELNVENEEGEGACFTITLPIENNIKPQ